MPLTDETSVSLLQVPTADTASEFCTASGSAHTQAHSCTWECSHPGTLTAHARRVLHRTDAPPDERSVPDDITGSRGGVSPEAEQEVPKAAANGCGAFRVLDAATRKRIPAKRTIVSSVSTGVCGRAQSAKARTGREKLVCSTSASVC